MGEWEDGHIGRVRSVRNGADAYGFIVVCEEHRWETTIVTRFIHRELLKRLVEMFQAQKPPLDISEALQIVAFIEGTGKPEGQDGAATGLSVL